LNPASGCDIPDGNAAFSITSWDQAANPNYPHCSLQSIVFNFYITDSSGAYVNMNNVDIALTDGTMWPANNSPNEFTFITPGPAGHPGQTITTNPPPNGPLYLTQWPLNPNGECCGFNFYIGLRTDSLWGTTPNTLLYGGTGSTVIHCPHVPNAGWNDPYHVTPWIHASNPTWGYLIPPGHCNECFGLLPDTYTITPYGDISIDGVVTSETDPNYPGPCEFEITNAGTPCCTDPGSTFNMMPYGYQEEWYHDPLNTNMTYVNQITIPFMPPLTSLPPPPYPSTGIPNSSWWAAGTPITQTQMETWITAINSPYGVIVYVSGKSPKHSLQ